MASSNPAAVKARQKRVDRGIQTELAAKQQTSKISLQGLMQFPLLQAIDECGGKARPGEIYERLASQMNLDDSALTESRDCGDGQRYNIFQQQVRWARQTAVMKGLIASNDRGIWELADPAYEKLQKARRGTAVLIYSLDSGLALWAHAEDAAAVIEKGSLSLIMLSPPYPVISRKYGTFSVPEWLSWMNRLTIMWRELLAEDGTLAVNLMDCFVPGSPALSPYVERFTLATIDDAGFHFAARSVWHSPTKLPHLQWAVKDRVRPKNSLEHLLFFSKMPKPNWNTRRIPALAYADGSEKKRSKDAARGVEKRPSGYVINPAAFERGENGPIPGNLIIAGGVSGSDHYSRRCREAGIEAHPARFPDAIPRRIISLTTEPGQTVYDPMSGSNTTGKIALELGRKFIASDPMLQYIRGSAFRFDSRSDFVEHHIPR